MQDSKGTKLAIYSTKWCPFCRRVWSGVDRLRIEAENRDLNKSGEWEQELIQARGRRTVPVLRITDDHGRDEWMPESADIVRWLEKTYA